MAFEMIARTVQSFLLCVLSSALISSSIGCKTKAPSPLAPDVARPQMQASPAGLQTDRGAAARTNAAANVPAKREVEFRTTSAAGAQTPYRLRQGDPVLIYLRGIIPQEAEVQDIVDEKGLVTLPYINDVPAIGKTASELERDIQRTYIERGIYRSVTVNVILPSQSFFVQGEVKAPQRYAMITGMTVLQAIAAAGGYTDFANSKRVTISRGNTVRTVNMRDIERNPKLDIIIESGDVIRVPRSAF